MKETFRDKSRDKLTQNLNSLGVRADLAERGRVEEKIQKSWHQRSLGVIDIPKGPIRWINILKRDRQRDSPPRWWVILGIPDERPISDRQAVKIKAVRKKIFSLFGKVVDVLSNEETIKNLAEKIGNLEIRSYAYD